MKMIERSVSDVIDVEYREYAMYVLESRAIPSAIDGLKMVTRKLLYSMVNEYSGKKVKLADLSGISKLGYHHSETSAAAAAVTITAEWNNNCPLFTGHGNFGSRLVQESAAPRYIYASLSENYKKFFLDSEVAPVSFNTENPEPAFYLPIIPWVLINGTMGLAVGFKCSILPRSIKDVINATKACLKSPKRFMESNEPIPPTFPQFRGAVLAYTPTQWKTQGIIGYAGKNYYEISELPIGYDRESYVTLLNEMCDKDLIRDYEDQCSKAGFGFRIKVSPAQKENIDKDAIKYFKLEKIHTEILTTLGHDGKLKIFNSVPELIAYFCTYRTSMFGIKIEYDKNKLGKELSMLRMRRQFINDVLNKVIDISKLSKEQILTHIRETITDTEYGKSFIRIPLYEISMDGVREYDDQENALVSQLDALNDVTPDKLFLKNLNSLKI